MAAQCGKGRSRSAWSTSRWSCTAPCAITGRSSGCCTRRTNRRCATSASARRKASRSRWEDLVKGYEYAKGQFVVLTKDDFKTAALEKTKTIDILDFVDPERDRRAVLRNAVLPAGRQRAPSAPTRCCARRSATSGRIGIAKIILRDAQHLAAVEAIGDALVLTMMRFADELADLDDFTFPARADIRPAELKMARQLIDNLAADVGSRRSTPTNTTTT